MNERVRAVLVTPAGTMLVIRRIRTGVSPYWVLPGGGVEPGDATFEVALEREIREEIGGTADILGLLHVLVKPGERQMFYLARIERWSFADRTGPEFSEPERGEYRLDEIPLTEVALDRIDLQPPEIAELLRRAAQRGDSFRPDMFQ